MLHFRFCRKLPQCKMCVCVRARARTCPCLDSVAFIEKPSILTTAEENFKKVFGPYEIFRPDECFVFFMTSFNYCT
jgi:hypothetical protein